MAEVKRRNEIEKGLQRELENLSRQHRMQIFTRLGDPPDIANVPQQYWVALEKENEELLYTALLLIWLAAAGEHGAGLSGLRTQAETFARAEAAETARTVRDGIQSRLGTATIVWRERIADGGRVPRKEVAHVLATTVGPKPQLKRISATQTTQAAVSGGEAGVKSSAGLSVQDTWFTRLDERVCPVCQPLHRKKRDVWAAKFPKGPPAHPNCRCWIHYKKEKRGERVIS